jgi:tRNA modification GTPase
VAGLATTDAARSEAVPKRDTIFALSSAAGRAAIAVIRASGPAAADTVRSLTGKDLPTPRVALYARLKDPETGTALDDGIVIWFPGKASETGEDVAEFQIHGSRATVNAVLAALAKLPGLRPAEPGEFTRRAFDNGKLDLTAVEGLADLVNSETEAQRLQALRQLRGELGRLYEGWRGRLLKILAYAEADIDFPDETAEESFGELARDVSEIADEIARHLDDGRRGERTRDGLSVAIVGAPNVGKSSLLNAIARRDVAIVSARAGTTRDVIEVHLDLAGYPVTVADTAGIRASGDEIELEGVRRAVARAEDADLRLVVFDASRWPDIGSGIGALAKKPSILVLNKVDLTCGPPAAEFGGQTLAAVSAKTGEGLAGLIEMLEREAAAMLGVSSAPMLTRLRHREALVSCAASLRRSAAAALPELKAEDLRLAVRALGRITGRVDVEAILDIVFRDFCIGK